MQRVREGEARNQSETEAGVRLVLMNDSARSDHKDLLSRLHAEIWCQPRPENNAGHVLMIADGVRATGKPSANGTAINGDLVSGGAMSHPLPRCL